MSTDKSSDFEEEKTETDILSKGIHRPSTCKKFDEMISLFSSKLRSLSFSISQKDEYWLEFSLFVDQKSWSLCSTIVGAVTCIVLSFHWLRHHCQSEK